MYQKWFLIATNRYKQHALHYLISTKLIVARFAGTGVSLIGYSNGHTKKKHRQLKIIRDYFLTKHHSFNLQNK
jgi:hypothetical protein